MRERERKREREGYIDQADEAGGKEEQPWN